MTLIRSYRDLTVWNKGMDLVVSSYQLAKNLPRSEEYGLASQIRRAAVSVPANIAEGSGRLHRAEFRQHVSISRGSLLELETLLLITVRLGYLSEALCADCIRLIAEISRMLTMLLRALGQPPKGSRAPRR